MALSAKVGQFTANTSNGNQAVTGIGFEPKAVFFWGGRPTSEDTGFAGMYMFVGSATLSSQRWTFAYADDDALNSSNSGRYGNASFCIGYLSAGNPTLNATADFVSMDADGFTINWTAAPTLAHLVNYLVVGGSDITNARAGTVSLASSGASQAFTGVGFQPDFLLVAHELLSPLGTSSTAEMGIGFASSSSDQAAAVIISRDNVGAAATGKWQKSGRVALGMVSDTGADFEAALSSFDADGFTLAVSDLPAATRVLGYLAIRGGEWKAGIETQQTSATTKDTATAGIDPALVLFAGCNRAANTAIESVTASLSIGAGDGTTEKTSWGSSVDAADPMQTASYLVSNKALAHLTADSTVNAAADLSFGTAEFTLNWTTADATAREFMYAAVGVATSAGEAFLPRVMVI